MISERAAEQRLLRAVRGRGGRLTPADAQALTGLPAERATHTLRSLLATYRSHLAVTESGELLYSFDPALRRRGGEPLRVRLERVAALLWRGFVVAFKVAIVVVLATYFVGFLALLVGFVVVRLVSGHDDHDDGGGVFPIGLLWWIIPWEIAATRPGWEQPSRGRRRPRKKVHRQVFDFVFGPGLYRADPAEADREVLAYLRAHQGRITATELVALRGLDLAQAEEEATRLMVEFAGEPEVTDDGVVVYVFRELRRTTGEAGPGRWSYAWEQLEKPPALTGNSTAANVTIGAINGFNLLAPLWLVPLALPALGLAAGSAEVWLRAVPLVFSATFFAIPLGRALHRALADRSRQRRNRRRQILRAIFLGATPSRELTSGATGGGLDAGVLAHGLGRGDATAAAAVRRELDAMVAPLGGDITLGDGDDAPLGRLVFPRLGTELEAVRREREHAPIEESLLGALVFDTAGELDAGPEMALPRRTAPSPLRLPGPPAPGPGWTSGGHQ